MAGGEKPSVEDARRRRAGLCQPPVRHAVRRSVGAAVVLGDEVPNSGGRGTGCSLRTRNRLRVAALYRPVGARWPQLRGNTRRACRGSSPAQEQAVSSPTAISLTEQRQSLCRQLQAQRRVIAERLGPESAMNGSCPRSRTMRFLTQQPALIIRLLVGLATLLPAKETHAYRDWRRAS